MNKYQIQGITDYYGNGKIDEASQRRLGSTYNLCLLENGFPMILYYITDNQGSDKEGCLRTSTVTKYEYVEDGQLYIVTTLNSIYYLKFLEDTE
jgi:hypothetical protein